MRKSKIQSHAMITDEQVTFTHRLETYVRCKTLIKKTHLAKSVAFSAAYVQVGEMSYIILSPSNETFECVNLSSNHTQ